MFTTLATTFSVIFKFFVVPSNKYLSVQDSLVSKSSITRVDLHDNDIDITTNISHNGEYIKYLYVFKDNKEAKKTFKKMKKVLQE